MNSKYSNNRTLVPLNQEPLNYVPPLIKSEFVDPRIPSAATSSNAFILPTNNIQNEFEVNSSWPNNTHFFVKKEALAESAPTIKFECNDYYFNQKYTAMKPEIPVKMEQKDIPSIKLWNMPSPICKSVPGEIKTFYICCNNKFDNKYQHFHHMLGHMEEEISHMEKNIKWGRIKCHHCDIFFKTENDMIRHKSQHIGFTCMSCLQTFVTKRFLIQHLKTVHNYKATKKSIYFNKVLQWHRNIWDNKSKILKNDITKLDEEMTLKRSSDIKIEQMIEPKLEPKIEPEIEPKIEPEIEPKVEPIFSTDEETQIISEFKTDIKI